MTNPSQNKVPEDHREVCPDYKYGIHYDDRDLGGHFICGCDDDCERHAKAPTDTTQQVTIDSSPMAEGGLLRVVLDELPRMQDLKFLPYFKDEDGVIGIFDHKAVNALILEKQREAVLEELSKYVHGVDGGVIVHKIESLKAPQEDE